MDQGGLLERLEGTHQIPATFQELDARYGIKLHALFHPCLETLTDALTARFDYFGMARRGIVPITHYLEITATGESLALRRPLVQRYTVELFRAAATRAAATPAPTPPKRPRERLLLDQHVEVEGFRRSGSERDLGFDDGQGPPVKAGSFRVIQVFTRPLAPPGQRHVGEVPEEFRRLRERPFAGSLPSPESLWAEGKDYQRVACENPPEAPRIWGRGNTDINHHVTVTEYLRALENHFVQLLHLAGLPVPQHRMSRLRCIFRRPFFAGDVFCVRGRPLRNGPLTQMHAGIYKRLEDEGFEAQPSIAACLDGVFEEDGPPRP